VQIPEEPVKADHDADLPDRGIPNLKAGISGSKEEVFFKKEVGLTVAADKPIWPGQHC